MLENIRAEFLRILKFFTVKDDIKRLEEHTLAFASRIERDLNEMKTTTNMCTYIGGLNKAIASATKSLLISKDLDGRIITLNDSMKRHLFSLDLDVEWTTDTEIIKTHIELYGNNEPNEIITNIFIDDDEVLNAGKTIENTYQGIFFGRELSLRVRKNIIRNEDLEPIGIIIIVDEVSE